MTENAHRTTGELVDELTSDTVALVRAEVRRGQREMWSKAREASRAAALLGGGAVLGALAAGTSAAVVVRLLDRFLPPTTAAAAGTLVFAGTAAALVAAGTAEVRRVGPLWPEETVAGLREDVRTARSATS